MRVAIVEPQPRGGLLHYAVQLGDALAARGHAVDLITPRGNELIGKTRHARMRAVLTPTVPSSAAPAVRGRVHRVVRRGGVALRQTRAWIRAVAEVRRGHYDAVIIDADVSLPPAAFGAWALTRFARAAAVTDICHNAQAFTRGSGEELLDMNPLSRSILRRTYPRFDLVFVHGERTLAEFRSVWPHSRLAVIPHGDERLFSADPPPPSDEEHILFFGDWRKGKGIPVLMDAFDEIAARRSRASLTIAGTPFPKELDLAALRDWAQAHGGRVTLVDRYVPIEEVPGLFGRARVVVAPYLAGYQSGVVHLAMTMARAVVATDVGDVTTVVVDGQTGLLVKPGDAPALASALERVVSQPELAASLGAAARRRVMEGSSWEEVAAQLESKLTAVVTDFAQPPRAAAVATRASRNAEEPTETRPE